MAAARPPVPGRRPAAPPRAAVRPADGRKPAAPPQPASQPAARSPRPAPTPAGLLHLQRGAGNSAVTGLIPGPAGPATPPGRRPRVQRLALTAEILAGVAGPSGKDQTYELILRALGAYEKVTDDATGRKLLDGIVRQGQAWLAEHSGATSQPRRTYLTMLLDQANAELVTETLSDPRRAKLFATPLGSGTTAGMLQASQNKLVLDAFGFYLTRAPELRDLILADEFLAAVNEKLGQVRRLTWALLIGVITRVVREFAANRVPAHRELAERGPRDMIADLLAQRLPPAELVTRVALVMRGALTWTKSGPDKEFNVNWRRDTRTDDQVSMGAEVSWEINWFGRWIRLLEGKPADAPQAEPPLTDLATMNCWEAVLFAGYKAGLLSQARLVQIHQEARRRGRVGEGGGGYFAALADGLDYGNRRTLKKAGEQLTALPARGDVVFFEQKPYAMDHVVLAVGGVEVMSLWSLGTGTFDLAPIGELDKPQLTISVTTPFR